MNRAIVVALAIGAVISSAAALRSGAAPAPVTQVLGPSEYRAAILDVEIARARQATRLAQRERIEARYLVDRAKCSQVGGIQRDRCLIASHAAKGRDLLEAAAPYEIRF